ncbi:MAG: tRNA pseudouridine(55) synthase TruB [Deltaproteobacteria bacterium]|nr:tRNA pseudouridine(55) synthase TruB [Deltaproteobacteria bacterium]
MGEARADEGRWGLLVLDKPLELSSHAAARRAARALGADRFGHAGTLDPLASGVLLVGLGRATRLLEYLVCHEKGYRARLRLGQVRDTHDREGTLLEERLVPELSGEDVERALARFRGRILQVPPEHSAVKVGGVPAYRRARRGLPVALPERAVEIFRLELLEWAPPDLTIDVTCSKGTYIRSLARDVGEALGTGACLWDLVRTRSGPYGLADAVSLGCLEAEGLSAWARVLPPRKMVEGLRSFTVSPPDARALASGRRIEGAGKEEGDLAVFDQTGDLLAVARAEGGDLRPLKVFRPAA